jgi:hypothetical protein
MFEAKLFAKALSFLMVGLANTVGVGAHSSGTDACVRVTVTVGSTFLLTCEEAAGATCGLVACFPLGT